MDELDLWRRYGVVQPGVVNLDGGNRSRGVACGEVEVLWWLDFGSGDDKKIGRAPREEVCRDLLMRRRDLQSTETCNMPFTYYGTGVFQVSRETRVSLLS